MEDGTIKILMQTPKGMCCKNCCEISEQCSFTYLPFQRKFNKKTAFESKLWTGH